MISKKLNNSRKGDNSAHLLKSNAKMKSFIYLLLLLPLPCLTKAQVPEANFDESKVPGYTLPDALIFNDGSKVRTKSDWDKRRSEIYKLFENEVYGKSPVWKGKVEVSKISQKEDDIGGLATRKEIKRINIGRPDGVTSVFVK